MLRLTYALLFLAVVLSSFGCGSKPAANPAGGGNPGPGGGAAAANPAEPPVEKRWASVEAVLAAAPQTPLTPQEVIWEGMTFVMDLPAGANLIAASNNNVMQAIVDQDLVINIRPGNEPMAYRKDLMTKNSYPCQVKSFPYYDDKLLIIEHSCPPEKDPTRIYRGFMQITDGTFRFCVWPEAPENTQKHYLTLEKLLLALKCGSTLRAKSPYPSEPLAAAKAFKIRLSPNGLEATEAGLPGHVSAGHLRALQGFSKLEYVDIMGGSGIDPRSDFAPLAQIPSLKRIRIYSLGGLHGPWPDEREKLCAAVAACKNLESVQFGGMELPASCLASLADLPKLKRIEFGIDQQNAASLPALAKAKGLESLHLTIEQDYDRPAPLLRGNLGALAACPALKSLDLNLAHEDDWADIVKLTNLESLEFGGALTAKSMAGLQAVAKLKRLNFNSSGIEKPALLAAAVANIPASLERFEFSNVKLPDDAIGVLVKLPALQNIYLSGCELSPTGLKLLGESKSLRELSISGAKGIGKPELDAFKAAHPMIKTSFY